MGNGKRDLTRTTLAVSVIAILAISCFWILQPFLPAALWATMIAVATWPLMLRLQERLWGQRWLATTVMTLALLLIVIVPLWLVVAAVVANTDVLVAWAESLRSLKLGAPPQWLVDLPMVGAAAERLWTHVAASGINGLAAQAAPYAGTVVRWAGSQLGGLGLLLLQLLLTVIFTAIMYASGEQAAEAVRRFGRRLAGARGETSVQLAAHAIRGVALGVVVTALCQALLGGISLVIAGVPFAAILTALMFLFCVAQIGAGPVMFGAVIWLYWSGENGWGTFMLACAIVVTTMDNFLRPILIRASADLPLLLVFVGVIGGLVAFGLVGIFIGPVVLTVAYTLLKAWIAEAAIEQDLGPPAPAG
jgi:predicted PurR-regulated permease PerM